MNKLNGCKTERFARLNHRDSETGLDPTHFRMYASGQGRWLTPDPVRACPLHPQNFDRYAYVGNSPTNRTDPRGGRTQRPAGRQALSKPSIFVPSMPWHSLSPSGWNQALAEYAFCLWRLRLKPRSEKVFLDPVDEPMKSTAGAGA